MVALLVRPFSNEVIDDAARLLASRHRAQRLAEPGLSAAFEDEATTRAAIEALAAKDGASGAVALRGDSVVGYLVGAPRPPLWGPNIWVEGAGHAASDPEVIRDLYGFAAAGWVDQGATSASSNALNARGPASATLSSPRRPSSHTESMKCTRASYAVVGASSGIGARRPSAASGLSRPSTAGHVTRPLCRSRQGWVESRFRDSRDLQGRMSYVGAHQERRSLMADLPLVDVVSGEQLTVADLG